MKNLNKLIATHFFLFIFLFIANIYAQNLVVNGDFDTGTTAGWTVVNKGLSSGVTYIHTEAHPGQSYAFLGRPCTNVTPPTSEQIYIKQNINLYAGKTYSFTAYTTCSVSSGYTYVDGGTISASINGTPIASHSFGQVWWYQSYFYTLQGTFTAPSTGSFELRIDMTSTNSTPYPYLYVDGITLMPPQFALTLDTNPTGNGTFTKTPNQATYYDGTSVSVKVAPGFGYKFGSWSGAIAGNPTDNPVSVVVDQAKTIIANLDPANILVKFLNGQNAGIPGVAVEYFDIGWQTLGTTDPLGEIRVNYTGRRQRLNFRLTYQGKTFMMLNQDYKAAPVVFQLTPLNIKLVSSTGAGITGGTVEYFNTTWQTLGTTDATGTVNASLMPGYYSFRITYAGMTVTQSNVNIATVNPVTFQTIKMDVRLEHPLVGGIPDGQVMYQTTILPLTAFGTTSPNGDSFKELLPGLYSFQMTYQGNTQTQNNVDITVTNPVSFSPPSGTLVSFWRPTKVPSGLGTGNGYGNRVDISGNLAVVGAASATNPSGVATGAVYIYSNASGSWQLQSTLYGSSSGEKFGAAVAIDGNVLVVGATGYYSSRGRAVMFRYNGSTWVQEASFAPEGYASSLFGAAVDVSGNEIIVGAPGHSYSTSYRNMGQVWWYTYNGSTWVNSGAWFGAFQAGASTGKTVAISGNRCMFYNINAVYLFEKTTSWSVKTYFLFPTGSGSFGSTLSMNGDYGFIGAPLESNGSVTLSGGVYIYHRDGVTGTWSQMQRINSAAPYTNEQFGTSIGISGTNSIIGCNATSSTIGSAILFNMNAGSWTQLDKITANDGAVGDLFGISSAIDGTNFIVGAPGASSTTGAIYIYPPKINVTIPKIGAPVINSKSEVPSEFSLSNNYPNPFNPSTKIRFTVNETNSTKLIVYNTIGQEVAVLFNEVAEPGRNYEVNFNGSGLASGAYFYKLQNGSNSTVKKMLLIK